MTEFHSSYHQKVVDWKLDIFDQVLVKKSGSSQYYYYSASCLKSILQ